MPPKCPFCRSKRIWKDGIRHTKDGEVQRYICRECGRRFSEGSKPLQKTFYGSLNTSSAIPVDRQICVSEGEMKNLARVETRQKRAAGATEDTKSVLFNFAWQLKKDGYKEKTIEVYGYWLRTLIKHGANLLQPETVKEVLANVKTWNDSSKALATAAYTTFLKSTGLTWKKPKYVQRSKLPFIPTEQEINDLIAHSGRRTSAALRIAKETGARIGEIVKLKWIDLNKEKRTLTINDPEKGSKPRILPVSNDLINALERLPKKSQWIFPSSDPEHPSTGNHFARLLYGTRKTAVRKLGNPRLKEITFSTLRHWKGTIEYHKTKDILHVMQVLGHKNVKNTMVYINLERAIFKENNDEFSVRAVNDLDEACKLLEVGFEYVCDMDGKKLFRKRK